MIYFRNVQSYAAIYEAMIPDVYIVLQTPNSVQCCYYL